MRTIQREIVGAFIFSSDHKVLLGHNKIGGVYQGMLVVPGGGIESGESELEAVRREVLEETGIDISGADVKRIEGASSGESEKVLNDTGETVLVRMNFYDFQVTLPQAASEVKLTFDDDYGDAQWYLSTDLGGLPIGPNTKITLQKLDFI